MATSKPVPIATIIIGLLIVGALGALTARIINREANADGSGDPKKLKAKVTASYPHDRRAFTQGLLWYKGKLYESTGKRGQSTLRRVDPTTGKVEKKIALAKAFFGEGLARVEDKLYQLTWQAGKCFVYDIETFKELKQINFQGQGWGLCYDGTHLIMSNGSSELTFRDPETFEIKRTITATWYGKPIKELNELEYVDGKIYANIWKRSFIAVIDPDSGAITTSIEVDRSLAPPGGRNTDYVLNGIARDPDTGDIYITGKNWPKVYKIEVVE